MKDSNAALTSASPQPQSVSSDSNPILPNAKNKMASTLHKQRESGNPVPTLKQKPATGLVLVGLSEVA